MPLQLRVPPDQMYHSSRREQDVEEEHRGRALAGNAPWRQETDPRPDRDEAAAEEIRRRGFDHGHWKSDFIS